jgi:hypothetical protein
MTSLQLQPVLMTRAPRPGAIKTRLEAGFDRGTVLEIAWAMLACTARRLHERWPLTIAVTPDDAGAVVARRLRISGLRVLGQGDGDLGQRLERAWCTLEGAGPVAFFGMDSPDVPGAHLTALSQALERADLALGPTPDGGYWTIAARRDLPRLLGGIDWGTPRVYDQTTVLAARARIPLLPLPEWPDVDDPADVEALMRRLAARTAPEPSDAPLRRLRRRLDRLCGARRGA